MYDILGSWRGQVRANCSILRALEDDLHSDFPSDCIEHKLLTQDPHLIFNQVQQPPAAYAR